MAWWRYPAARRVDLRLSRALGLLVAVLVGLIVAHPGAEASSVSGHPKLSVVAGLGAAHHSWDCPQELPGHADQSCATLSFSTAPVTATVTPPAMPVFMHLSLVPAKHVCQLGADSHHLRPRLTQLAVSRT